MATGLSGVVPVKHLKVSDAVAAQLEELVRSGSFGIDGKLPPERELAEQFGVGRSSMREAIRKLETLDLIVINHGVGIFCTLEKATPHFDHRLSLLTAGDATALELFEIRYALEPRGTELSAERSSIREIQEMKKMMRVASSKMLTTKEFVRIDLEFHRLIIDSTRNRLLSQLYSQISEHHAIYSDKVITFDNRRERAHAGHMKILAAIENRDSSLARKEALSHLKTAEKDLAVEITKRGLGSS